jgi:anhydro-N-acetylmuramic acid kinase
MKVLGFMSGTSLDGVDAAVIDTDGAVVSAFGVAVSVPFADTERAAIISMTKLALAGGKDATLLASAEAAVHASHLRAATALKAAGGTFALAGFHGQTVLHRPQAGFTWQVGDPARLAEALGVPIVAELRQADLAAGGLGAPLVPVYHEALAKRAGLRAPCAFLNIGGVANLTLIDPAGPLRACDTGPGNGMMDLLLQQRGEGRYDDGGRLAAQGRADCAALANLLAAPVLTGTGPRALDRYDIALDPVDHLATPDALATLVAFTAECVVRAQARLPVQPLYWYVCGGGRHNPVLMTALRQRLGHCENIDVLGLRGDFIEAEAMAFLALRSTLGKPITFPDTTGARAPTAGGVVYNPAALQRSQRTVSA